MKYEILNRWTGAVQFTAEIEANEDTPLGVRNRRNPGHILAKVDAELMACGRRIPVTVRLHRGSGGNFATLDMGGRCVDPHSDELIRLLEKYLREIDEDAIVDARIDDLKLARELEREVARG